MICKMVLSDAVGLAAQICICAGSLYSLAISVWFITLDVRVLVIEFLYVCVTLIKQGRRVVLCVPVSLPAELRMHLMASQGMQTCALHVRLSAC